MPASVIEVGAVIGELKRRGVGREHYAVDFSDDALAVLRRDQPGVHAAVADVTETPDPFGAGPYSLAVASHVVEHLEDPGAFLRALRQVPLERLVVEVPLANLFFGRLKARVDDRANHPAGHVQFSTREAFVALLERSGWQVLDVRVDASALDAETFAFGKASRSKRALKRVTECVLPRLLGPLWTRLYHARCTALCVARPG